MKIKSSSWATVCGVSLIPTVFFFIQEIPTGEAGSSAIYFGLTPYLQSLLTATLLLLLTTMLIASVSLKKTTSENALVRQLSIAFVAFISSIAIKTLLLISNFPWDTQFLRLVFYDPSFPIKIVWLLLPFIILFIFLVIKKDILNDLVKFLGILGIVFLTVVSYRIVHSIKAFHTPSWENKIKYESPNTSPRKVIWVVLDEFDPEIAFSETNLVNLPNFKLLLDSAVNHSQMYAPSNATAESIPSMLMGVPTYGNIYNNIASLDVITSKNKLLPFKYENTIFHKLAVNHNNSSILGFYHPYCATFTQIQCKSFPMISKFRWYSGITHAYAHKRLLELVDRLLDEHYVSASRFDAMADITEQQLSLLPEFILDANVNFTFIHLNVPHLPASYAQELFDEHVDDQLSNYKLNLRLADYALNLMLKNIDKMKDKKVLLILSSDHWFRPRDVGISIPHPALFMAKINDDSQKIKLTQPSSSIYISEAVNKFLNNDISSHSDIEKYFSNKSFHNTYIDVGASHGD